MKRQLAGLIFSLVATASPAFATGEIACEGDGVSVDLLVGRLQVLSVLRAVVTIGEKTWSSEPGVMPGTPIAIGQAFEDEGQLLVDFTDDNVEGVIGRLRAFSLEEGDDYVSAGVFAMKGAGAFVVDCSLRG